MIIAMKKSIFIVLNGFFKEPHPSMGKTLVIESIVGIRNLRLGLLKVEYGALQPIKAKLLYKRRVIRMQREGDGEIDGADEP